MHEHNEFIQPGTYQHYKGGIYVVTEVVTHMDGPDGKMAPLQDPLVVYRDLSPVMKHINGRHTYAHQRYARTLSEFNGMTIHINKEVKRFVKI